MTPNLSSFIGGTLIEHKMGRRWTDEAGRSVITYVALEFALEDEVAKTFQGGKLTISGDDNARYSGYGWSWVDAEDGVFKLHSGPYLGICYTIIPGPQWDAKGEVF